MHWNNCWILSRAKYLVEREKDGWKRVRVGNELLKLNVWHCDVVKGATTETNGSHRKNRSPATESRVSIGPKSAVIKSTATWIYIRSYYLPTRLNHPQVFFFPLFSTQRQRPFHLNTFFSFLFQISRVSSIFLCSTLVFLFLLSFLNPLSVLFSFILRTMRWRA